jgi:transposase-like protein
MTPRTSRPAPSATTPGRDDHHQQPGPVPPKGADGPTVERLRALRVDEGLTVAEIAARLGTSVSRVKLLLSDAGIRKTVSRRARRAGFADLGARANSAFSAEVVRRYANEGQPLRRIAADLDVDLRAVWRELDAAGIERRPQGRPTTAVIPAGELRRLYQKEGRTVTAIAGRYGITTSAVRRHLDRHGIARRGPRPPIAKGELVDLYLTRQLSLRSIAELLGCPEAHVRADLERHQIPCRSPGGRPRPASSKTDGHNH